MIGKILNLGKNITKKQEFRLTIEDVENTDPVATEAKVEEAKPEPAPQAIVVEETEAETAPQAIVVEETEAETAPQAKKKSKAKKSKTTTKKKSIKKTVASSASSWEQPFWVKAMYNNTGSASTSGTTTEGTFATDYLIVQSASRRRPGPSLNKFKDMVAKKRF